MSASSDFHHIWMWSSSRSNTGLAPQLNLVAAFVTSLGGTLFLDTASVISRGEGPQFLKLQLKKLLEPSSFQNWTFLFLKCQAPPWAQPVGCNVGKFTSFLPSEPCISFISIWIIVLVPRRHIIIYFSFLECRIQAGLLNMHTSAPSLPSNMLTKLLMPFMGASKRHLRAKSIPYPYGRLKSNFTFYNPSKVNPKSSYS